MVWPFSQVLVYMPKRQIYPVASPAPAVVEVLLVKTYLEKFANFSVKNKFIFSRLITFLLIILITTFTTRFFKMFFFIWAIKYFSTHGILKKKQPNKIFSINFFYEGSVIWYWIHSGSIVVMQTDVYTVNKIIDYLPTGYTWARFCHLADKRTVNESKQFVASAASKYLRELHC